MEPEEKERDRGDDSQHIPPEVRAEIHFPDAVETKRTADQERYHTTQKVITVAAWGAFIAALAYAVVAQMQLGKMTEQVEQLYRQAEVENAGASHRAAEVFRQLNIAQAQVKAAQDSLTAIREQMRLDQRAWIGLVHTETVGGKKSEDGSAFSFDYVRLVFRNTGKTPALNVSQQRIITSGKWGYALGTAQPLPAPDFDKQVGATERFYQQMTAELIRKNPKDADQIRKDRRYGSPTTSLSSISPAGRSIAPNAELVADHHTLGGGALRDKDGTPITMYILGKITYNDIFPGTKRHTTKFCLMWYENGFIMCDAGGNWMD